jgi:hypothetical protein
MDTAATPLVSKPPVGVDQAVSELLKQWRSEDLATGAVAMPLQPRSVKGVLGILRGLVPSRRPAST